MRSAFAAFRARPRPSLTLAPAVLVGTALLAATSPADARSARHAKPGAAAPASEQADTPAYGRRADVQQFAAELAERRQLDAAWVTDALAQARYQPAVARLIMPPAVGTAKNWQAYRARFVEPERIRAGAAFWQANAATLAAAEERFGVPAAIVVGVIGVETFYGRVMGDFRVLDALATLAFDFPRGRKDRSGFFRDELEQFLVWTSRERLDARSVRGSYAGALGLPQFMPGSLIKYAIDFDGDGHIDLRGSAADSIGSVASYLAAFGWKPGQPTHYAVDAPTDTADRAALLAADILPSFTPAQFTERGARLGEAALAHDGPLALVELQNGSAAPSYVAGTQNFYAVTRYNWSSYYALAVIELGRAVAAQRSSSLSSR